MVNAGEDLPIIAEAFKRGLARAIVPARNGDEAALVKEISACAVRSLREAVGLMDRGWEGRHAKRAPTAFGTRPRESGSRPSRSWGAIRSPLLVRNELVEARPPVE